MKVNWGVKKKKKVTKTYPLCTGQLAANLTLKEADDHIGIVLSVQISLKSESDGLIHQSSLEFPLGSSGIDMDTFKTEARFAEWLFQVTREFPVKLGQVLEHETALHFLDAANFHLDKMGLEQIDKGEMVALHVKGTTKRTRTLLDAKGPGQRSQWHPFTLRLAVRSALRRLPPERHTFDDVAAEIKRDSEITTPSSGAALQKLMKRHNVPWKELLKEAHAGNGQ